MEEFNLSERVAFLEKKIVGLHETIQGLEGQVEVLRGDLSEAVELAHRLIAKRFMAFPYFGKKDNNLYIVVRDFLAKHDRLPE